MGFLSLFSCMFGILWGVFTIFAWFVGTHYYNRGWELHKPTLVGVIRSQFNWVGAIPKFFKTLRIW